MSGADPLSLCAAAITCGTWYDVRPARSPVVCTRPSTSACTCAWRCGGASATSNKATRARRPAAVTGTRGAVSATCAYRAPTATPRRRARAARCTVTTDIDGLGCLCSPRPQTTTTRARSGLPTLPGLRATCRAYSRPPSWWFACTRPWFLCWPLHRPITYGTDIGHAARTPGVPAAKHVAAVCSC
jgi:hypothetical protein